MQVQALCEGAPNITTPLPQLPSPDSFVGPLTPICLSAELRSREVLLASVPRPWLGAALVDERPLSWLAEQGIKRGIMELCDVVAVNKADGATATAATNAAAGFRAALGLQRRRHPVWAPKVTRGLFCSWLGSLAASGAALGLPSRRHARRQAPSMALL
jgi:Methylmalonyl Co-A mutase-associated GTPase MeaB